MQNGSKRRRQQFTRAWLMVPILIAVVFFCAETRQTLAQQVPQSSAAPESRPALDPPDQPYHLPPEKLARAVALGKIRPAIHFGAEFWNLGFLVLLLASGKAARASRWIESRVRWPWVQAALFAAFLVVTVFIAVDLPFWVLGHAFSLHYGISVEGWPAWSLDLLKALGLDLCIEAPLLVLVNGLMRWHWSRSRYWLWFSAAMVPIAILGTFLLPALIDPLFNTFEPLAQSHPARVRQLQQVVARTGIRIPPERMFLMKASEKSNGLNAYVTGFGATKRIVVWDTTADRMNSDEILFTFAHESGHYVLTHIPKGLVAGSFGMFALFWAVARVAAWLVEKLGQSWQVEQLATVTGLAVLLLAFAFLQIFTEPIENAASRYIEHQADVYGQEAIHGLVPDPQKAAVAAFNSLGAAYLDDPNPNHFLEFWTDSHPSTQRRATFAAHYDPWASGHHPLFFSK